MGWNGVDWDGLWIWGFEFVCGFGSARLWIGLLVGLWVCEFGDSMADINL